MGISNLQRYILLACAFANGRVGRAKFSPFYATGKAPKNRDQVNAITVSLERLIDRHFLIGYGMRTSRKWFIREVSLTPKGRKIARLLLGKQQELPLRTKRT